MQLETIAHELLTDSGQYRFRPGFEKRIAKAMSTHLSERPGDLEPLLRLIVAVEQELAATPIAAAEWRAFVDQLVARFARANLRVARQQLEHRDAAKSVVDSRERVIKPTPKDSDVAAGPLARFLLQPQTKKRRR
jgi:hypothetical protein